MPYPSIVNLLPDPKDHVLFTRQPFTAAAPVYRKKEYQTRKMNAKVLNTLEYNKIINRLTEHATSDPGRKPVSYTHLDVYKRQGKQRRFD